ncbi:MAG TPA: hypothetical protein VEY33_14635 [Gemmatimonadota bacterium]|nr:hypothetical protein [Gemmatimonadota bacterium]
MRTIVSGIAAAAAYWIVIVTFLAMAMPTRAQVEAYIEAANSASVSEVSDRAIDQPLAG